LDLHQLMQALEHKGALFRSVTEPYDTTTAIGRLFVTLVAALAQWERENLGERVREGMTEMVRQGNWHGGPTPYGYDNEEKALILNEAQAAIVREVFEKYVSGASSREIALDLNRRGLRTQHGAQWTGSTIIYMIS